MVLVQVQQFGTGTRYKLEILQKCGKMVKTKSQKVLQAKSYVCRSYRGKTGKGGLLALHPAILNRVNFCASLQLEESLTMLNMNPLVYVLLMKFKYFFCCFCNKNSYSCTPAPLFNVGWKFTWWLLTTIAWHSFSRLGTTLNQGREEILGIFEQV